MKYELKIPSEMEVAPRYDLVTSHSQMLGKFEYGLPAKF